MKNTLIIFTFALLIQACQHPIKHLSPNVENLVSPRFNHVYLNVSDMEASIIFYTSAFDMQVTKQIKKIKRTGSDGNSQSFAIHLSLLKFPDQNFVLEIKESSEFKADNSSANFMHLGIDVKDIEAASQRIISAGGAMTRPVSLVETEDITAKTAFFTGPDGETIELMQILSGEF